MGLGLNWLMREMPSKHGTGEQAMGNNLIKYTIGLPLLFVLTAIFCFWGTIALIYELGTNFMLFLYGRKMHELREMEFFTEELTSLWKPL